MRISHLKIENFRCVQDLELALDDTTVLIGANNTGKTAVIEAIRIALTRRWGRRGTGFTDLDVHSPADGSDPKTSPPVRVWLRFEEPANKPWNVDMASALDDLIVVDDKGRNFVWLRVTCEWSKQTDAFEPVWEFLDNSGKPLSHKAQRSTNLNGFFAYTPPFFLPALRDASDEFGIRSSLWASVLKTVKLPSAVQAEMQTTLDVLDTKLLAADPKLGEIAAMVGQAANVAVGHGSGDARLRMMPMNSWDMISRAAVVIKNEEFRPWLPLSHHGQGLQSLSVIFLFQAAIETQLADSADGADAVFLLEEPEAHLHPQASRTLWEHLSDLPGQKIVTTHSPFFVQNVPIRNLRLARLENGCTKIASMPHSLVSSLPWNSGVAALAQHQGGMFFEDPKTGCVACRSWFDAQLASNLAGCFKAEPDKALLKSRIDTLRSHCRVMLSQDDEYELSYLGRRIRGEIFFARQWVLVEGQSEFVLLHAIGRALGHELDRHGVAVIDFQNNGDPGVYVALATCFGFPWRMVTDGDAASQKFIAQVKKRGFTSSDWSERFITLTEPNCLEAQLIADGHGARLREILAEVTSQSALTCPDAEFRQRLAKEKLGCVSRLAVQVATDPALAAKMPAPLVDVVDRLKAGLL